MSSSSKPRGVWQPPSLAELQALLPAYRFLSLIGRGGMGAVFKATQLSLNRPVAIKVLPASLLENEDANFAARFRQESLTMAKLNHPGIVGVFESGEAGGLLYIVMEFVDGTDVARMIQGEGKLAPELVSKLVAQVCDALHYAHEQGVVHRDIKPANLLVTRDGTVKIADFGLAKHDDATLAGLTKTNVAIGTPDFLAPEAWTPGTALDRRSDLYALGVTLYQMLTGEVPRGLWKMPSVKAGVDARFDAIIDRAMQPDREARYQSSAELRRDLEQIQAKPRSAGHRPALGGPPTSGPSDARRSVSPRPRRVAAALVALAVLLTGVIAVLWPRAPKNHAAAEPLRLFVINTDDDGPGSLRQIIAEATDGTTITFASNLSGQTIRLTSDQLALDRSLTIDASALPGGIRLDGNRQWRAFKVASNATVVLDSLTITNGRSPDGAGGGIANGGDLLLRNCTVVGNQARSTGGGISSTAGRLVILNSTFTRNIAGRNGGAIASHGVKGSLTLIHCTISGNRLDGERGDRGGGGVYSYHSMMYCTNSIIAGNSSGDGPGPDLWSRAQLIAAEGCLIGDAADSTLASGVNGNLTGVDARLAALGDHGGPTPTMPLSPGSPAIDAAAGPVLASDQRGFPRPAGAAPDIGAVELEVQKLEVITAEDDGPGSLREIIAAAADGATIRFATNLSGRTIRLTGGELRLDKSLTIDGSELARSLRLDGNRASRVFFITSNATVVLDSLTITNGDTKALDDANIGGGGIYSAGKLTVNRCTLAGNSTSGGGGGIGSRGPLTVNQCTLTGNRAFGGGGIGIYYFSGGTLAVNQSTLSGNKAVGRGAVGVGDDVFSYVAPVASFNSIISDLHLNQAGLTLTGTNLIETYAVREDRPDNPAPITEAPRLAPLGDYGGPTPTMPPLPGSPAIDAGSSSAVTSRSKDQRGFPRRVGAQVDVGAVEVARPFLKSVVTNTNDSGPGSLRQAMKESASGALITFATNLSGQTIRLTSGHLQLDNNLTIDASALTERVILDAIGRSRVFNVPGEHLTNVLTALVITNGNVPQDGAGIYNRGHLTLNRCAVKNHIGHVGAGLYNLATLILNQSTVTGNSVNGYGGGIYNSGRLTVNESTLSGNRCEHKGGGAIHNAAEGTLVLNQSTLTENRAVNADGPSLGLGGAVWNEGIATLNHCTLTGNLATRGGAWHNEGTLTVSNSIVAGNGRTNISGPFTGGHNFTEGNPLLGPLGDYGGPTPTMPPLPGSPALNAAVNSAVTNDQRGFPRPAGQAPDLGAVEGGAKLR